MRGRQTRKPQREHVAVVAALVVSRLVFEVEPDRLGRAPGVANPRDIGSFATASRSSVNTLAVVPELTRKKEIRPK